jgi:hypothetical protein
LRGSRKASALESAERAGVHADTHTWAVGLRSVEAARREFLHGGEERVPGKRLRPLPSHAITVTKTVSKLSRRDRTNVPPLRARS